MKKSFKKIIATLLVTAVSAGTCVPAFAAENTNNEVMDAAIYETEAFKDFQENGLPATRLSPGEEQTFTYDDGSSIVLGVRQNATPVVDVSRQVTRDPVFDGQTILYAQFTNADTKRTVFEVNLIAEYRYGAYNIMMDDVYTDIIEFYASDHVRVNNDGCSSSYTMPSASIADIEGIFNVSYSDYDYNQSFAYSNFILEMRLVCANHGIDVITTDNIKDE